MKKYHALETGLDSFKYLLSPYSVAGTMFGGCDAVQKKNSIKEALNL